MVAKPQLGTACKLANSRRQASAEGGANFPRRKNDGHAQKNGKMMEIYHHWQPSRKTSHWLTFRPPKKVIPANLTRTVVEIKLKLKMAA